MSFSESFNGVKERELLSLQKSAKSGFMFLTRGPLPMLPLWKRFFADHDKLFSIHVHALPGYELNLSTSSVFYRRADPQS
ncbi:hypothetical protein Csa_022399, partial [Cucumis sativus]